MNISREEQETFFRITADSREYDFYTRDTKFVRLLKKRGYEVNLDHQGLFSAKVPIKGLTVRSAHRAPSKRGLVGGFKRKVGVIES